MKTTRAAIRLTIDADTVVAVLRVPIPPEAYARTRSALTAIYGQLSIDFDNRGFAVFHCQPTPPSEPTPEPKPKPPLFHWECKCGNDWEAPAGNLYCPQCGNKADTRTLIES